MAPDGHRGESVDPVEAMDRAIGCLALEVSGAVYEDVVLKWSTVRQLLRTGVEVKPGRPYIGSRQEGSDG